MGGFSKSGGSNTSDERKQKTYSSQLKSIQKKQKVVDFIKGGGITGAILRGVTKTFDPKRNRKSKSGDVYAYDEAKEKIDYKAPPKINTGGNGGDNNPQGIELAKASTTSATILGPAEIQKKAANEVKGPTTTEMSADEILLRNKRRGRRVTNITAKKTLDKNYTLSKKTLLG